MDREPEHPEYARRIVDDELDELMPALPAIALDGAKAVGKTATGRARAATLLALEDSTQRQLVTADPQRALAAPTPVLIDEWQLVPEIWDHVRRSVDAGAAPGSYLLTGSRPPRHHPAHSGARRIVRMRMRPMTLFERGVSTGAVSLGALLEGAPLPAGERTDADLEVYAHEITASGLPGIRTLPERARRAQLGGYLATIVEREFGEAGHSVRNPAALQRWMRAYAAATASTASYEKIRDAATSGSGEKPSRRATTPYRDVLEALWIVDPVPAWHPTSQTLPRLARGPVHHLMDPALAARLLDVTTETLLTPGSDLPRGLADGPLLGSLFESLATLDVRVYAQRNEATTWHLRTLAGRQEVDLIVQGPGRRIIAIEVKLTPTVNDSDVRHLHWLRDRLGDRLVDAIVITTGTHAFRRKDGIGVVPLALLGP